MQLNWTPPRESAPKLERLADLLEQAVAGGETPGAVALVAQHGDVLFHRAFGSAQLVPTREPMRPNTVFDVASLTKVVATTPAVLLLVEEGAVRLQDPVARFIPEFTGEGKEHVDLRHLLTHCSGLPAWLPFYKTTGTVAERLATVYATPLKHPADGLPYLNDFQSGRTARLRGVTITAAIVTGGASLAFDLYGRPVNQAANATIRLSNGTSSITLTVDRLTGEVSMAST
jgi:CubicO group peptidase (beta-lactamase class C family)